MEDLIAWAERLGLRSATQRDDDLVHLVDDDVSFSIALHHDMFPVEAAVQDQPRIVLGVFEDVEDARRFLTMELGALLRKRERMPRLAASDLPPGFVLEQAPTALWLSWFTGSAEFPQGERMRAVNFSRVERAPLDQIESSFLAPNGSPLYAAA
jgi:hypothetical protein